MEGSLFGSSVSAPDWPTLHPSFHCAFMISLHENVFLLTVVPSVREKAEETMDSIAPGALETKKIASHVEEPDTPCPR